VRSTVVASLLLIGACSFQRGGAVGGDDDGGDDAPPVDAAVTVPDAGCDDDDADGVCNTADICADNDDRLDGDGDGKPDGCDDWKCGAQKPSDPGLFGIVGIGSGTSTLSFISFGNGPVAAVAPGQQLELGYSYGIQVGCPNAAGTCRAQIEFGIGDVRLGCLFDDTVVSTVGETDFGQDVDMAAPTTPGLYQLRAKVATVSTGCGNGTSFTGNPPPEQQTFAILCVAP
jgi:hypothetical protein